MLNIALFFIFRIIIVSLIFISRMNVYIYTFSTCFSLNYRKFNHWQKRNWTKTLIVSHVKQLYENVVEEKELISPLPLFSPLFDRVFGTNENAFQFVRSANFTRCRGNNNWKQFSFNSLTACRIVDQFADNGRLTVSELK